MIRLDELHDDQLAQISLSWVPMAELYDTDPDDDVDSDLVVLAYAGTYSLEPLMIYELERLLNEGGSRDEMILLLHEWADDLNGEGWDDLDVEGEDHGWGSDQEGSGRRSSGGHNEGGPDPRTRIVGEDDHGMARE
jgi:hypothetical protein